MVDSDEPEELSTEDTREWEFDLEDVGEAAGVTIEPETIDPLNAVFFLLGVAATLALVFSAIL